VHALPVLVLVAAAFVVFAAVVALLGYALEARARPRPRVIPRTETRGLHRPLPAHHDRGRFRGRWDWTRREDATGEDEPMPWWDVLGLIALVGLSIGVAFSLLIWGFFFLSDRQRK
jgi:hypothetical protein